MSNPSGFLTLVSKKKNHRTIIIEQIYVFFNNKNPALTESLTDLLIESPAGKISGSAPLEYPDFQNGG